MEMFTGSNTDFQAKQETNNSLEIKNSTNQTKGQKFNQSDRRLKIIRQKVNKNSTNQTKG